MASFELRPKNMCLVCLQKIKSGKYCPSCRQKIKTEFNKLVKHAWSQAVQTVYSETVIHSVKLRIEKK
jgi:hypothetical protein